MSAGDEPARPADGPASPAEGYPAPGSPGDPARNPALVSFWLLEPVADAAMTYFYAQLFTMDTEIRAMFPAAMDVQRRRFFAALSRSPQLSVVRRNATGWFLTSVSSGARTGSSASASATTRW